MPRPPPNNSLTIPVFKIILLRFMSHPNYYERFRFENRYDVKMGHINPGHFQKYRNISELKLRILCERNLDCLTFALMGQKD